MSLNCQKLKQLVGNRITFLSKPRRDTDPLSIQPWAQALKDKTPQGPPSVFDSRSSVQRKPPLGRKPILLQFYGDPQSTQSPSLLRPVRARYLVLSGRSCRNALFRPSSATWSKLHHVWEIGDTGVPRENLRDPRKPKRFPRTFLSRKTRLTTFSRNLVTCFGLTHA